MEIVVLKVEVRKEELAQLQSDIQKLQAKPVKLRVDTSGFQKMDKAAVQAMNATTKYTNATTRAQGQTDRLSVAQEKTAQATQRRATAEARYAQQAERTRTVQAQATLQAEKTATVQARAAESQAKAARAQAKGAESTAKATKANNQLGDSFVGTAVKMAKWQVMGDLVALPIRAMKEALSTMRDVDDQMVDIRKVTDFSEKQMATLEKQSYKTASAYGMAADEYLSSVAAFSRAGYQEQSAALAELAAKTQIVGDMDQQTAEQFLLSVDAAYQYGGSIEKLTKVLDGANEIDNNYATSITKIAEGLGKVAPIASQAHVGIDELSAGLGTITAVTQRSGTEAATALRALFLNIMGDTKTEIDEGVTWTTGEIAGLRDVLKIYASDVVEAADATGTLINPMEAIGALSQSMKDGVLTEQKLMEMVSDIGGKLRSSQLLALIQNWDMYESMLSDFGGAVGSADREVENAMDSWSRKTEVLKNKWTEFVSGMVSSDAIKGGLDAVTGFIDALDSDIGRAAVEFTAISVGITGIAKAGKLLAGTSLFKMAGKIPKLLKDFGSIAKGEGIVAALGQTFAKLPASINPATVAIAGLIAAAAIGPKVVDAFTTSFDEHGEQITELEGQYDQLMDKEGELASLEKKMADGSANGLDKKRYEALKSQREELEKLIQEEKKAAAEAFQNERGTGKTYEFGDRKMGNYKEMRGDEFELNKLTKAQESLNEAFLSGEAGASEYREGLSDLIAEGQEYYDALMEIKGMGADLSDEQKEFLRVFSNISDTVNNVSDDMLAAKTVFDDFGGSFEQLNKDGELVEVFDVQALREGLEEVGLTAEEINAIIDQLSGNEAVVAFDTEGDPEEIIGQLEELGIAVETADGWQINVDGFMELSDQLGISQGAAFALLGQMSSLNGITLANAKGEVMSFQDLLSTPVKFEPVSPATITNIGQVGSKATDAKGQVDDLGATTANPTVTITGADEAKSKADGVAGSIKSIPTSWTTTINIQQNGTVPTIGKNATGSRNFRGGATLLGDEYSPTGEPKPELVLTKGEAYIAGLYGPEIRTVPRGAQIFTYKETKDILSRGEGITMPAFAGGMQSGKSLWDYYLGGAKNSQSSNGSSASKGGSSGGKSSGKNSGSSGKSSSSGKKSGTSSKKSGGKSSGKGDDPFKDEVELRKAEYDFLEASGAGPDELIAKSKEIQAALKKLNDHLRATGGEQKDIVKNSTEWWKELENIRDTQKEIYENQRDLLGTQIELMEKQGGQTKERIGKLKEIQANLHDEAEFLRSIGAEQKEINELSIEWWETQKDIRKIQEDLWDELDDAVNKELDRAAEARDDELEALDKELDRMRKEREEKEDQLDLEEKILAVQEAQDALANAQNERTVRMFNAVSGQWEWVADAEAVKDAQKDLDDAQKDLDDYKADLAYDAAVEAIEARKTAIEEAYDALEEGWEDIVDSVQEPTRSISEILADIAQNGTPLMKAQVETTGKLLGDLNNYISAAINANTGESYVGGGGLPSSDYSGDKTDYSALMDRAKSYDEFMYWANQREQKMQAQGINPGDHGWRSTEEIYKEWEGKKYGGGSSASKPSGGSSDSKSSASSGAGKVSSSIASAVKNAASKIVGKKVYDNGGVLDGMGGIKATEADEMVVPPDVTGFMLAPQADGAFRERMAELGYLYGSSGKIPAALAGQNSRTTTYDNSGDTYQFGDVRLTEAQAKGMSVYDLAQLSRSLGIYGWN